MEPKRINSKYRRNGSPPCQFSDSMDKKAADARKALATLANPESAESELRSALRELQVSARDGLIPAKELEQPVLLFLENFGSRNPALKIEALEIFVRAGSNGKYSQEDAAAFIIACLRSGLLSEHMQLAILRLGQTGSRNAFTHLTELADACEMCFSTSSVDVYVFEALADVALTNPSLAGEVKAFLASLVDKTAPEKGEKAARTHALASEALERVSAAPCNEK